MNATSLIWGLALVSVTLSAVGQLLLKLGMTSPAAEAALLKGFSPALMTLVGSAPVIGGLACYGVGMVLWLICLSKLPLTSAYPLVSLAIVLVVILSVLFLGETMTVPKLAGSALVVIGVLLIGRA